MQNTLSLEQSITSNHFFQHFGAIKIKRKITKTSRSLPNKISRKIEFNRLSMPSNRSLNKDWFFGSVGSEQFSMTISPNGNQICNSFCEVLSVLINGRDMDTCRLFCIEYDGLCCNYVVKKGTKKTLYTPHRLKN